MWIGICVALACGGVTSSVRGDEAPEEEDKHPTDAGEGRSSPLPKHGFVSLSFSQDVLVLGSSEDVCSPASQTGGNFSCFRSQGSQYLGTPQAGHDTLNAGLAFAATRVAIGGDVFVAERVSLGLRVGTAFRGGGPIASNGQGFLPLLLEGRAAYWFPTLWPAPSVIPNLFLAGGIAEVDATTPIEIHENSRAVPAPSQLDNPRTQTLDVWQKTGSGFVGAGAGVFIPIGASHGVLAELKGMFLFPSTGGAMSLGLGYAFGL